MKRDYDQVLRAAEIVNDGYPMLCDFTRDDFQDAQMEFTKRNAKPGEPEPQAFMRLSSHPTMVALDRAWRETQKAQEVAKAQQHIDARAAGRPVQDTAPTLTSAGFVTKKDIEERVTKAAEATRKPGETFEQAYSRTLEEHPELYRAYREARS